MDSTRIAELLDKGILLSPDGASAIDEPTVHIVSNYTKRSHKRTYEDFVGHFNQRFKALSGMLRNRQELQGVMAISRLAAMEARERVVIIGMVSEKAFTKNQNIMLTVEDQTGEMRLLVTQRRKDVFETARDIVLDEVVGFSGVMGEGVVFVDAIIHPDIPIANEIKKGPIEEYLAIIGDPQVGSTDFLEEDFGKMLDWLNGKVGNAEQRRIASLVRYVIVPGDLVDGVGVYPGQEEDLTIKDIKEQYAKFAEYMRRIPAHIQIICTPGNHDAGRIAEPQPPIYKDFAGPLYDMPNVVMVSNPSVVTIGARPNFPGHDILIYHGYSLPFLADNVPSIRERGGQKRVELIMKFQLQRRHLAPTHASNMYIPDPLGDPLVIKSVPDIYITGHIHRVASAQYRGVTMINASAWLDLTEDQERRGIEPQPARLPVVNLQTRDVRVINFYTGRKSNG